MKVDYNIAANKALLARASQILAFNRLYFTEQDARMMTVICIAESSGFLDMIGPIFKVTADDIAKGFTGAPNTGLYVGNADGSVDVSAWQINKAPEGLDPQEYAAMAYELWKKRGWQPWVQFRRRDQIKDWSLWEAIVADAASFTTEPVRYVEASKFRKKK